MLLQNISSVTLNPMYSGINKVNTKKAISWFLITTILLVALMPSHYHLHHLDNEAADSAGNSHSRIIDLHVLTVQAGDSHHDEDTESIAASPDGAVKKSSPGFPLFVLLSMVLLLLPAFYKLSNVLLSTSGAGHKQHTPYFAPLLRAPPLF